MSQFVCNHCFIDYGDKQSFIEHTHKVVERKEKRAVKSTTKSQTDNTELGEYFSVTEVVKTADNKILARLSTTAKLQIEAMLKQQDIKSRIDAVSSMKQRFHEPIEHDGSYISISIIDEAFDEQLAKLRSKA